MARLYLSPPHMHGDERSLLLDAFDSNWIAPLGPHVDAFEHELASLISPSHSALALSSGTAALHLALRVLNTRPNDLVLTSSFTFAATANAITYENAEPVFIDSEPRTWNMDPKLLAQALEDFHKQGRTVAAVIAVDLYGQCAAYDEIVPLCKRFGVPLIEDAAEALGASFLNQPAGSFGDLAAFSFNGNKIITTSGGGMLVASGENAQKWIAQARHLSTQARDPAPHYQHSTIGYNYRLSNLLAAVGRGQLKHLDERVNARRRIFELYREALGDIKGIDWMPEYDKGRATRWLTCVTFDQSILGVDRETIRKQLEAADIEARPLWKPMHMQPVFEKNIRYGGAFSEDLFARGLCLPSGSAMTESDVQRVANVIRNCLKP